MNRSIQRLLKISKIRNFITMKTFIFLAFAFVLGACGNQNPKDSDMNSSPKSIAQMADFNSYWYANTAEISRYKLEQARYGEMHDGDVVLVFVTEDLGDESHVKNDRQLGGNSVPILKLNYVKHFTTGIYDYSMMSSIFTPVDQEEIANSLRVTTSAQEWCGHAYMSLDLRGEEYEIESHSYFEGEADKSYKVKKVMLEDEIFNLIRIKPNSLPIGEFEMIPSTMYCRLMHVEPAPYSVKASSKNEGDGTTYTIRYPELDRTFSIHYRNEFPYKIQGWEETYISGFGSGKKELTTKATLTHTRISPYWTENAVEDIKLRKELGL